MLQNVCQWCSYHTKAEQSWNILPGVAQYNEIQLHDSDFIKVKHTWISPYTFEIFLIHSLLEIWSNSNMSICTLFSNNSSFILRMIIPFLHKTLTDLCFLTNTNHYLHNCNTFFFLWRTDIGTIVVYPICDKIHQNCLWF